MKGLILLSLLSGFFEQTYWMGGAGVQGPVSDWGTRYYKQDSITAANEGQVSLIATSCDYTSTGWVRHSIDNNSGICTGTQGFMPANIGNNGRQDLVAHTNDSVFWYKNIGNYNFTRQIIGYANDGGEINPCVFPCDLDKDKDIDILVGTASGLGWFENKNSGNTWIYNNIDNTLGYHRVSAVDIDLDEDFDLITVDNNGSYWTTGNINIFKNNGAQVFSLTQSISNSGSEGWRVYPQDFNNDNYPDIYSVGLNTYIYLNGGSANPGNFTQSFYGDYQAGEDFDGGWPVDINMDGNMDLICGGISGYANYGFCALLGNGTGANFTIDTLIDNMYGYVDGIVSGRDIDLDGLPDMVGTWGKVGWLKQNSGFTFTLYPMDVLSSSTASHWSYAAPIGYKCTPSVDILVTQYGEHIVYENKMLKSFASTGYIESSILQLSSQSRILRWLGWEACIPDSTTLKFYWRIDSIAANLFSKPWNGPYYAVNDSDSILCTSNVCGTLFQYKVEFSPTSGDSDIATLYRIWIRDTTCGGSVEESRISVNGDFIKIIANEKILLSISLPINNAELAIYNSAGEKILVLYKGALAARNYEFVPILKSKGVYLVILSTGEKNIFRVLKTAKIIRCK